MRGVFLLELLPHQLVRIYTGDGGPVNNLLRGGNTIWTVVYSNNISKTDVAPWSDGLDESPGGVRYRAPRIIFTLKRACSGIVQPSLDKMHSNTLVVHEKVIACKNQSTLQTVK